MKADTPNPGDTEELHQRLGAIDAQIEAARRRLQEAERWQDHHALSARDLQTRHAAIKAAVEAEVQDAKAHGHHVTALEESLRQWLREIEL